MLVEKRAVSENTHPEGIEIQGLHKVLCAGSSVGGELDHLEYQLLVVGARGMLVKIDCCNSVLPITIAEFQDAMCSRGQASSGLDQHDPQGEDVHPIGVARSRHLWRGIAASAAERFQGFIGACNVQIAIFNNKRLGCRDQDIFWLDIPVGDPPRMEMLKSIRELAKKLLELGLREQLFSKQRSECAAAQMFDEKTSAGARKCEFIAECNNVALFKLRSVNQAVHYLTYVVKLSVSLYLSGKSIGVSGICFRHVHQAGLKMKSPEQAVAARATRKFLLQNETLSHGGRTGKRRCGRWGSQDTPEASPEGGFWATLTWIWGHRRFVMC